MQFINQTGLVGCSVFSTYKISFCQNSLAIQSHDICKCFLYLLVSFTFKQEVVKCLPHRCSHHKIQLLHVTSMIAQREQCHASWLFSLSNGKRQKKLPPNLVADPGQGCLASPWAFSLTIYLSTSYRVKYFLQKAGVEGKRIKILKAGGLKWLAKMLWLHLSQTPCEVIQDGSQRVLSDSLGLQKDFQV